jgi:hypothetical protein
MKNRKSVSGYAIALLFAGMAISCSSDQVLEPVLTTPNATAKARVASQISGDTLVVVRYQDGSFVSFHEFSPGDVAIRHSHHLSTRPGEGNSRQMASAQISSKLDALSDQHQSLVDMYRALVTAPDAQAISRLTSAQARLVQAKAEQQTAPPDELDSLSRQANTGTQAVAAGCTPDYYNDNYGAQWFIDNFVNVNKFRRSQTNRIKAGYHTVNDDWTKVVAMAPDFATGIHFSGERYECYGFLCTKWHWVPRWSFDISPRGVEEWYIYSNKAYRSRAKGYSPCQRVHLGACNDRHVPVALPDSWI